MARIPLAVLIAAAAACAATDGIAQQYQQPGQQAPMAAPPAAGARTRAQPLPPGAPATAAPSRSAPAAAPPSRSAVPAAAATGAAAAAGAAVAAKAQPAGTALLYRVDDGVFELQQGKAVDLTDRKILLHMRMDQRWQDRGSGERRFTISVAGRMHYVHVGERIDLKREEGSMGMLKEKDECYLDVLNHVEPQGAPQVATFRLFCL